jgi:23S rRNA (cytosine1962-C5)-methyltransferase
MLAAMARPRARSHAGGIEVRLARKLERTLRRGHPWVWRDALTRFDAQPGAVVAVMDGQGGFVARGLADEGPIGVRVLTTDPRQAVDAALFARRIEAAAALRDAVVPPETDAYRLLHGEGDRLPGVVCDVYGACAVLRLASRGAEAWRDTLVAALEPVLRRRGVTTLLERGGRRGDNLLEVAFGELPAAPLEVKEHGMRLLVDVAHGQKTGLFLDHRDSRRRVRELARGLRVLNLYGYTGAFSVAAGLGGAIATETVDLAAPALALADASWRLNGLPDAHTSTKADVHAYLEASKGAAWDLVIADPPSFAPNEASLDAALHAYGKLHAGSLAILGDGGLYLAASCSSHVRRDAFEDTLFEAAGRARRPLQILGRWGAGADHPSLPTFVEGDYLKAILVRA